MLKLNTKLKIPLLLILISCGGLFLYQYLTFIPSYSSATTTIETPIYDESKVEKRTLADINYMQQVTPEICANTPAATTADQNDEHQYKLIDGRDNKEYWVAKLAGTCWMTQDLDLDLQGMTITNENTGSNLYKGSDVTSEWTGGNVTSKDPATTKWPTSGSPIEWWNRNTGSNANGTHKAEHNFLGNLYSFEAATAGTGSKVTNDGGVATGSICPAGWKLPLSGSSSATGSFKSLEDAGMNSIAMAISNPYYFQYGGVIAGSLNNANLIGYYWSATSKSDTNAYILVFGVGGFATASASSRYGGLSVRCVVRGTPAEPEVLIPSPNVSVTIPKVLTLDVTDSVNIETNPNSISTGTFTASVTSNANYSISLNATSEDASATSLVNIKDNKKVAEIPTITSTTQPTIGISSWGIRKCNNLTTETCIENYKPLPTKNSTTGNPFLTSTPGNHQHLFQIGIGIGPELPSGTYTTSITVTASQN